MAPSVTSQLYSSSSQAVAAHLDTKAKDNLKIVANAIRTIAMDAVERAGSGHAGTPMGCADIAAYLYGHFLRLDPEHPTWINRDRFILSAGHASLLQYACLHMRGFNLSISDIKQFRQLNSKTPSHPQFRTTEGVETTTGVDGQGVAHAVGQALGLKLLGARFNRPPYFLFNAKVVVLAGDGCLMEGISHEACSLAGHLNLNNLILIYDRNKTSLDGFVSESCSENTVQRFESYGWEVHEVNGHDLEAIHKALSTQKISQTKPVLLIADTVIGKSAPTKAGSYFIHSDPIGKEEIAHAKEGMNLPQSEFFVPQQAYDFFNLKKESDQKEIALWQESLQQWKKAHPDLAAELQKMHGIPLPRDLEQQLQSLELSEVISGRKASHAVLNFLGNLLPFLYGGSADLARSDMTHMESHSVVAADNFLGRNIKYGVREFGMGGIAIGLAQTDLIRPFVGTFLGFSDYMLSAVRMASLMKLPIVYQFTHDSIFIGQDGPTHQPIEHLAHLRGIPQLQVIRPADRNEIKMSWLAALKYQGPTALVLSRQDTFACSGTDVPFESGVGRGAYIIKNSERFPDLTLIATGSEVSLALAVSTLLEKKGYSCRVVSMPCWSLFDQQPEDYRRTVLGAGKKISIEAASEMGWHKYLQGGVVISINEYGKSAPAKDLADVFGFTPEKVVNTILKSFK